MYQLLKIHVDENQWETWENLTRLPQPTRKEWFARHLKEVVRTLENKREVPERIWNLVGNTLINDNLYQEAELFYDNLFRILQKSHKNYGSAAYFRGISRLLQGRFKEAQEDFKLSRQFDLHMKQVNSPAARALSYLEETIIPTREIIKKNHDKLISDINASRQVDYKVGPNMLRTIHKWNSSSPLYSRGVSQGGGYLLTLRSAHGETKAIAIDPGYDFYSIMRELGLSIADLDAILITHDHDDHTESVEGILSLLAKYNDHNKERKTKVLNIFGSAGVMLKFHGLLSATDAFGKKEINFKLLIPGNYVSEVEGQSLMEQYGFRLRVTPAFHTERWTNQESSVGMVIETNLKDKHNEPLHIGITGDSRFEVGLGKEYTDCQVILLNIGSVEKEEGKLLTQHLGMLGSINLIKEARLGKPLLGILTEFGEEFAGKRDITSQIIENWAQPLGGENHKRELKVIPADVNLEVNLTELSIRESDTHVFFPYTMIEVAEGKNDILKYKFTG